MARHDFRQLVKEWDELEAAGIPLEPLEYRKGGDKRNSEAMLTIRVGRPSGRSRIVELKNNRFAYTLPIFIRRNVPGKTVIRGCWLEPPWCDTNVELLEDSKEEGKHPRWYVFPGDTERFARDEVVNHRMNCILAQGDIREGLLLWLGAPPPETYKHQTEVAVTFGILDQWDVDHTRKLAMCLHRRPAQRSAEAISKPARGHLLSKRDVIIADKRPLRVPRANSDEAREKEEQEARSLYAQIARFNAERAARSAKAEVDKPSPPRSESESSPDDAGTETAPVGDQEKEGS